MRNYDSMAHCAKTAWDIQNACNLSGVVNEFKRMMEFLWDVAEEQKFGTKFVNQHPISKIMADKIAQLTGLTGTIGDDETMKAFDAVKKLMEV